MPCSRHDPSLFIHQTRVTCHESSGVRSGHRAQLTTLEVLIGAVTAVVRPVAHPPAGDAAVVGALKLAERAELV